MVRPASKALCIAFMCTGAAVVAASVGLPLAWSVGLAAVGIYMPDGLYEPVRFLFWVHPVLRCSCWPGLRASSRSAPGSWRALPARGLGNRSPGVALDVPDLLA